MLVRAANVCRYDLENDAMVYHFACWIAERRKVDLLNFDSAGFDVNYATIGRHLESPGAG
jgi:hypothetical protein